MADDMFATAEQMEQRTEGAILATRPYLDESLKAATAIIRAYCGWLIAPQTQETVWVDDLGGPLLALPSLHIESIDTVKLDGVEIAADSLRWLPDGRLLMPYRIQPERALEITMTHGFDAPPANIVDLTLQMAARALGSPMGFTREQAGSVSVTHTQSGGFGTSGGTVLLAHEAAGLAPYRIGWMP